MLTGCHVSLRLSDVSAHSIAIMLQVNFHGPETMEEKAAVFAPLRQMDSISVSEHLSVLGMLCNRHAC